MKLNIAHPAPTITTHEGAPARHITPLAQLRRSVCSCLLWEKEFYESGETIAKRIAALVAECAPRDVADLAIEAREQYKLRHVPLLLMRELARHPKLKDHPQLVSKTLARVIQRADEPAEFLALYWRDNAGKKQPLSKQVKRGLAWAMRKFDEYALGKYDRAGTVRLRDVLFLSHAKPKDEDQAALWKKLAQNELATPDTWEVALSAGADKKETFERLIREGQLGYLALLRNLRNMVQAGCDTALIEQAILARKGAGRVLPFRFIAAAQHAKQFEPALDAAMQAAMGELEKLPGRTVVLVDHSGSMSAGLSGKSDLTRADAAAGVAILVRGVAAQPRVFAFSDWLAEVAPRQGMALRDAIEQSGRMGGTMLGAAVRKINELPYDRLIVVTDEQSHDSVPNPAGKGYLINVASAKNGVGYGPWVHIDGWSEAVVRFIAEHERLSENTETS
jgi:60 kDa SS-A/Ro ribonucleoprotein